MKFRRSKAGPEPRQRLKREQPAPQPPLLTYRGRNQPEPSPQRAFWSRRFWLQRLGLLVLLVAVVLSLANILSLSSNPQVLLEGRQSASYLRDTQEYETAATAVLATSIWNRNKITVNTRDVKLELQRQFPELTEVNVTVPLLAHRPLIYIKLAEPALILATNNGNFVIDNRGKALVAEAAESPLPDLPVLKDESGLQVQLNKQALPGDHVSFILNIKAQLAAKQIPIDSMTLPPAASELHVKPAGHPFIVKFNLQDNPGRQAGTFLATLERLKRDKTTPAQYIDVRVAGRAYYQ